MVATIFHILVCYPNLFLIKYLFRSLTCLKKLFVCFLTVELWEFFMYYEYKFYVRNMIFRYFSRLDAAEGRISQLEGISRIFEKLESEGKKDWKKKQNKISRTMGKLQKVWHIYNGNTRGQEREKGKEEILETIMIENFLKLNCQTLNHRSTELREQTGWTQKQTNKNLHLGYHIKTTENQR